jgi:hypothetical protein
LPFLCVVGAARGFLSFYLGQAADSVRVGVLP